MTHHDAVIICGHGGLQVICRTCGGKVIFDSLTDDTVTPADVYSAQAQHEKKLWWHAFGKWIHEIESVDPDTGETGPAWARALVGPTEVPPERAQHDDLNGMTYLASWDHHPTDDEQDATDPPEVKER